MNEGMNKNQEVKKSEEEKLGLERYEKIDSNFNKRLEEFVDFYKKNNIEIPEDFEVIIKYLWEDSKEEIINKIKSDGFNDILIVPPMTDSTGRTGPLLASLLKKMEMGDGYNLKPDYLSDEPFDENNTEAGGYCSGYSRIMLVHKDQNLIDSPILKEKIGVKGEYLLRSPDDKYYALSLEEYLIFQKKYFEETGQHLDEKNKVWLSTFTTTSGKNKNYNGYYLCAGWEKEENKLGLEPNDPDDSFEDVGVRTSYRFVFNGGKSWEDYIKNTKENK